MGKGRANGGSIDVDFRDDALYAARRRIVECKKFGSNAIGPANPYTTTGVKYE